jgi:hypothetical protein
VDWSLVVSVVVVAFQTTHVGAILGRLVAGLERVDD